jgi:hypothetical protein
MGYTHTNSQGRVYALHSHTTESRTGKPRTLYYFSQTVEGAIEELPRGYEVVEAKTGLPLLKKRG